MESTEKKLQVVVADSTKPIEVLWREGDAATLNEPQKYKQNVSLGAIIEFVEKKRFVESPWLLEDETKNTTIIHFSKEPENYFVILLENPNDELATELTAKLIVNPDFLAFGINKDKKFNQQALEQHIRKYAHCFGELQTPKKLIDDLRNFEVRYEQTVQKEDNRQGNKVDNYTEAIKFAKGELPKTLLLKMPLFKNSAPHSFEVEIEVDKERGSNAPVFSFYSMDVELALRSLGETYIDETVEKLKPKFPCLEVQ